MFGGNEGPIADIVRRVVREELVPVNKKLDMIIAHMQVKTKPETNREGGSEDDFMEAYKEIQKIGPSDIADLTPEDVVKETKEAERNKSSR